MIKSEIRKLIHDIESDNVTRFQIIQEQGIAKTQSLIGEYQFAQVMVIKLNEILKNNII